MDVSAIQRLYQLAKSEPGVDALGLLAGLLFTYLEAVRHEMTQRLSVVTVKPTDLGHPRLLSVREVANTLGCSPWVAYERIRTGKLPAVRDGRYRVEETEVERYKQKFKR